MSRSPRYGLALAAAVVLAWVGCQGHACLGPEEISGTEATEPTKRGSELAPPQRATPQADPVAAAPAESAGTKRGAAEARLPIMQGVPTDLSEPIDADAAIGRGTEAAGQVLPQGWTELAQSALAEPDAELRSEAIQSVSVYHGAEAVAVLTEVAAGDPDTDNRVQALHALWNAAADGLDQEGEIKRVLEDARADPDPDIAELAQKALADLERLAARRPNGG